MATYDGVPSIRLEGDKARALALIPEGKLLLHKVQNVLRGSGANTYSMARRVEDGYILALCSNGQNIIQISVAVDVVDEVHESPETPLPALFPDFYSGTVQGVPLKEKVETRPDGTVRRYYVCQGFTPTPDCIDSHPDDGLLPGGVRQDTARLAVEPQEPWMSELKNQTDSGQVYSQYGFLRSSMYSGTMRKVVQLVMGLGRIGAPKMRDPRKKKPDSQYIKEVADKGVQVRYDYKFHRTHGITVADDGRLWLVEISMQRGILAMPLPVFPHSETEGFKARAEKRRDDAMVWALEELGCLPTGECLPASQRELDAKIENGTVIRLATPDQMGAFYDEWLSYSSALGWAFSPDGREAHNTGWNIGADNIQSGAWFQVNIHIGATKEDRRPKEPIAEGSASLRKVREGRIYCDPSGPGPRLRQHFLPFKTYEPLLEGLVSHEGVPAGPPTVAKLPISDTPVFVCFVDGKLKVVFYYHNPEYLERPPRKTMTDEFGRCLLAGEWELVQGEKLLLPRMMYTNDFDYRREIQTNYTKETLESVDLGYKPGYAQFFVGFSDHWATGVRFKGFSNKHQLTVDIAEKIVGAVLVPRFSREAFYFATADWEGKFVSDDPEADPGDDQLQTWNREWQFNIRDPHIYSMFTCGTYGETNFFAIPDYIVDSVPDRLRCRGGATCPFVSWGMTDWQPEDARMINHYYRPSDECAEEFADEGSWLESCQPLKQASELGEPRQWPAYDRTFYTTYPSRQSCAAYLVTNGHNGPIEIETTVQRVNQWWANISPDNFGNYQQISATHSAIGEDCVIYDTAPHDDPTRTQKVTGYTPGVIPPVAYPAFVGVNIQ